MARLARTAALMAERSEASFSIPSRWIPPEKYSNDFFSVIFSSDLAIVAQGEQFAICIQVVVLALVGRVAGGIFHLVRIRAAAPCGKALAFGAVVIAHFVDEQVAIRGKVLIHFEGVAEETSATRSAGAFFCAGNPGPHPRCGPGLRAAWR